MQRSVAEAKGREPAYVASPDGQLGDCADRFTHARHATMCSHGFVYHPNAPRYVSCYEYAMLLPLIVYIYDINKELGYFHFMNTFT